MTATDSKIAEWFSEELCEALNRPGNQSDRGSEANWHHVALKLGRSDRSFSKERFIERFLRSAASQIARIIDRSERSWTVSCNAFDANGNHAPEGGGIFGYLCRIDVRLDKLG